MARGAHRWLSESGSEFGREVERLCPCDRGGHPGLSPHF